PFNLENPFYRAPGCASVLTAYPKRKTATCQGRRIHNRKAICFQMTSLPSPASHGKPKLGDTNGDRELLGQVLKSATTRAKLTASTLESISAALRQKAISCQQAIQWAEAEQIDNLLQFGPPSKAGGEQ